MKLSIFLLFGCFLVVQCSYRHKEVQIFVTPTKRHTDYGGVERDLEAGVVESTSHGHGEAATLLNHHIVSTPSIVNPMDFRLQDTLLTLGAMLFFGLLTNMPLICLTMTKYYAELFSGTIFESDFLILITGAFKFGIMIANVYQCFVPLQYHISPLPKLTLIVSLGSFVTLMALAFCPSIIDSWSLSAKGAMIVITALALKLGVFIGFVGSCSSSFIGFLPKAYGAINMVGHLVSNFGIAIGFLASAFSDPPHLAPECNGVMSKNTTKIQRADNSVGSVLPGTRSKYMVTMGSAAIAALVSVLMAWYCLSSPIILHYEQMIAESQADLEYHTKTAFFLVSSEYPARLFPWGMFVAGLSISMVGPLLLPNVVSTRYKDHENRFSNVLFYPVAFFLYYFHASIGLVLPRIYIPQWLATDVNGILFSPLWAIALVPLLLMCNFKDQKDDDPCKDPFPNAPRWIDSDGLYLFMLSAYGLLASYSKSLIWRTSSHYIRDDMKREMGIVINWYNHCGQTFGTVGSMLVYFYLSKSNPLVKK